MTSPLFFRQLEQEVFMSKTIFLGVILLILSSVFYSCGDTVRPPITEATLTLVKGQSAEVGFDNLTLGFYRLTNESRCPMNAYCVWPGIGEIIVYLLQKPGHDPTYVPVAIVGTAVSLSELDDVPAYVKGYQIRLIGLSPYPSGGPTDTSAYIARIKVTKVSSTPATKVQFTRLQPTDIMLDSVHIDESTINDHLLKLQLSNEGCLKKHYYWLYMSPPGFSKSNPPQADLYLRHFNNFDTCKSTMVVLADSMIFDLKPIRQLYDSTIGGGDSLLLNLYDYYKDTPGTAHTIILH